MIPARERAARGTIGTAWRARAAVLLVAILAAGCGAAPSPAPSVDLLPSAGASASLTTPLAALSSSPPAPSSAPAPTPTRGPAPLLQATTASARLPVGLSRSVAFVDGTTIVVSGGLTAKGTVGDIVRIDPVAGTVSAIGSMAQPVHDAAGASLGGAWLVLGGGTSVPLAVIQSVSSNGSSAKLGQLPAARADLVAVTLGDSLVIAGGSGGGANDRAVLATMDGKTFTSVAMLTLGVRYPAAALLDGLLYLFGGEGDSGDTAAIQVIDPARGTVTEPAKLPATLSHASAFVLGGRIYIAGGRHAGTALADILSFDPLANAVTPAGRLPQAVSDAAVAVTGARAWLIGGERAAPIDTLVALAPAGT